MEIKVRPATAADSEAIRDIYNHEVENGTSTFDLRPRTRQEQHQWLEAHVGAYTAVVATEADPPYAEHPGAEQVVGFGSISQYRQRPAYSGTAEVSVYVHRQHHRKGIGKALLQNLVSSAKQGGFHTLISRISGPNEASHGLFLSAGFEHVGTEREVGRKFNQWLDIRVYQIMLAE